MIKRLITEKFVTRSVTFFPSDSERLFKTLFLIKHLLETITLQGYFSG